jgi:hypothetical protein
MPYTIDRLIWPFQQHFRWNLEYAATKLFQSLDKRIEPEVFLVGVLEEHSEDRHEACVEPECDFWAKSEIFEGLQERIQELVDLDPESGSLHSLQRAQELANLRILKKATRRAFEETIEKNSDRPNDREFFVSHPRLKEGYWVSTVLSLPKATLSEHPRLKTSKIAITSYRDCCVATNLIDACVLTFLENAQAELEQPHAGEGFSSSINIEYALTDAAVLLMSSISNRVDQGGRNLFEVFNVISSLHYEKSVGAGRYVIAAEKHPSIKQVLRFDTNQPLNGGRSSRKLLELASPEMPLHTDSSNVFGLCTVANYNGENEDLFELNVTGHQEWNLCHNGHDLMRVKYSRPFLANLGLDRKKLEADLPRLFKGIAKDNTDDLISLIEQAQHEPHGTMLLVSEAAETEALRLGTQATQIVPTRLTPSLLSQLTAIDGSVILSPECICYAIGAILDGLATEYGDPSRGARFNSAIRYVENSTAICLAVVVSEDGGTDFLPNLPAPIDREEIDSNLKEIEGLNDEKTFSSRKFNGLRKWINQHEFYLLEADCDLLNELMPQLEELHHSGSSLMVKTNHTYREHPAMNRNMFYNEYL